jgi:hypothetical protein
VKDEMTFASAAERIGRKQSKYESILSDALASGDRFAKNSAELMLDRVNRYKEELFQTQEAMKAEMGIGEPQTMAYGGYAKKMAMGGPPYRTPTSPMEVSYDDPRSTGFSVPIVGTSPPGQSLQRFTPRFSQPENNRGSFQVAPNAVTSVPGLRAPGFEASGYQNPAYEAATLLPETGRYSSPGSLNRMPELSFPAPSMEIGAKRSVEPFGPTVYGAPSSSSKWSSQDKMVASGAATSVASSLMSAYAASRMKGPRRPITTEAPRINTTVDINPQLNELNQGTMAFERALTRSGMPGTQGMALSRRNAADRMKAGLYQSKQQGEQQLQNQQAMLTYQNQGANASAMNAYQEAERNFGNERLAYMNRAGAEALGTVQLALRDKAMMDLDREKAQILKTGYNSAVVSELATTTLMSDNFDPTELQFNHSPQDIKRALERLKGLNLPRYQELQRKYPQLFN